MRFEIIGSYTATEIISQTTDTHISVTIPMIDSNQSLLFGVGKAVDKMKNHDIYPTEIGFDIMALATLVYLADTRISREIHAQDSWTREIVIVLPVANKALWCEISEKVERILKFLTGDIWNIKFEDKVMFFENQLMKDNRCSSFDGASLFSGGMDSLISTINLLEQDENVLLLSHAGDSLTKNAQNNLIRRFDQLYKNSIHECMDLWMSFESDFLPKGGVEKSTRGRSFLFIAFAVFTMTGTANLRTLLIPENGMIALNVPLDELRAGSHSTRTTHPFYLQLWNEMLDGLCTGIQVINPYWNKTKGEMAEECINKDALFELMRLSFSCSSPVKATRLHLPPQHCGYCVPCIIRRAAMIKAFGKDSTPYVVDDLEEIINDREHASGIQIRSFQYAIDTVKNDPEAAKFLIHKPGPLSGNKDYLKELAGIYRRGLIEVDTFIEKEILKENETI